MLQGAIYITYIYLTFLLVRHLYLERKRTSRVFDCIDIQCEITPVPFKDISQAQPGESSSVIRERVIKARDIQTERFKDFKGIHCNAQMTERMIHQFAEPDEASINQLRMAMERFSLCTCIQPYTKSCTYHC